MRCKRRYDEYFNYTELPEKREVQGRGSSLSFFITFSKEYFKIYHLLFIIFKNIIKFGKN